MKISEETYKLLLKKMSELEARIVELEENQGRSAFEHSDIPSA
jgi:hypothetical protein